MIKDMKQFFEFAGSDLNNLKVKKLVESYFTDENEEVSNDVVFSMPMHVTRSHLQSFVNTINQFEKPQPKLSVQEVIDNKELLNYICSNALEDGVAMYDSTEFYRNDGWSDWEQYR